MLAGEIPFQGRSSADIFDAVLLQEAAPLHIENRLFESIVERALAKERGPRYQSAGELFDDLKPLTKELNSEKNAASESPVPSSKHTVWQRRVVWALSGLLLLASLVYLAAQLNRKPGTSIQAAVITAAQPLSQ